MEKNVYRIVNSMLLVAVCLLGIGEQIGIAFVAIVHVLLALGIIAGITFFCYVKARGRILALTSLMVCLVVIVCVVGPQDMESFWKSYFIGISGRDNQDYEWGVLQECVQVLVVSVVCFLVQFLTEKLFKIKLLMAGALLALLFVDLFVSRSMEHVAVTCVLLYVIITYVEWTQKEWKKNRGEGKGQEGKRQKERKQYVVWLMPFLLLYFILLLVTPAPDQPYDWKFVKDAYNWLRETFLTISQDIGSGEREDFEMAMSGFSEDGRLLGGLKESNQEVMHIQGQKSLKTNVYLVGKVYDSFTGKQWMQTDESFMEDRRLDALETIYAIWMYDEEKIANYIHSTRLQIDYQYFNTGYLFAPLKTWKVGGQLPYNSLGGNLQFEEKQGYGTGYDVNFFQINVDHPLFYQFLDAGRQQDEAVWRKVQREYLQDTEARYAFSDLEKHRDEIHRIYGQETALSDEVRKYLKEIIGEAQTDVERLKAIEAALADYTYTMTPGALPEEIASETEFLDYFLLESKQGFCSYFASAFVLLARAEGIPARYVEGFCVPVEGEAEVSVYSNMAHAWPEVYIDGVGWIPFEPTPGYERIRYTPWEMVDDTNHNAGMGMSWEMEDEEEVTLEGAEESEASKEEALAEELEQNRNIVKVIVYTLLITLCATICFCIVDTYIGKRRYRKWTLEKKIHNTLQRNMQLLSLLGYRRKEFETLEELEKRAWAVMNCESEEEKTKLSFLHYYEEILYGGHQVTEDMYRVILEEQNYLMQMLKKWKRFAYIYCKIVYRYYR